MNYILVVFCAQLFVANKVLLSEEIENSEWRKFKVKNLTSQLFILFSHSLQMWCDSYH